LGSQVPAHALIVIGDNNNAEITAGKDDGTPCRPAGRHPSAREQTVFKPIAMLLLAGCALQAQAAVSTFQAERLGRELTPLGAERAGNAEGTIPAWTGGITKPPAGYKPGMHHPDPYAADKPLLIIDKHNLNNHRDRLPEGMQRLLTLYPDYGVRVYPTRRSAALPERLYALPHPAERPGSHLEPHHPLPWRTAAHGPQPGGSTDQRQLQPAQARPGNLLRLQPRRHDHGRAGQHPVPLQVQDHRPGQAG